MLTEVLTRVCLDLLVTNKGGFSVVLLDWMENDFRVSVQFWVSHIRLIQGGSSLRLNSVWCQRGKYLDVFLLWDKDKSYWIVLCSVLVELKVSISVFLLPADLLCSPNSKLSVEISESVSFRIGLLTFSFSLYPQRATVCFTNSCLAFNLLNLSNF